MTQDEIAAERERFEKIAPHCGFPCPKPVAGVAYTFMPTPFAYASTNDGWQLWMRRAEIARAEQAELRAENERLRERVRELEQQIATMRANGFVATASSGDSGATFREFPIIIQERSW